MAIKERGSGLRIQIPGEVPGPDHLSHHSPDNLKRAIQWARDKSWFRIARNLGEHVIPTFSSPTGRIVFRVGSAAALGISVIVAYHKLQKSHHKGEKNK